LAGGVGVATTTLASSGGDISRRSATIAGDFNSFKLHFFATLHVFSGKLFLHANSTAIETATMPTTNPAINEIISKPLITTNLFSIIKLYVLFFGTQKNLTN